MAAQGFLAAQGLHGLRVPVRGAQGLQVAMAQPLIAKGNPITVPNTAEIIPALIGRILVFIVFPLKFCGYNEYVY